MRSRSLVLLLLVLAGCSGQAIDQPPSATPPLPTPSRPAPLSSPTVAEPWTSENFGDAWALSYPATWTANTAGIHAGSLALTGLYADVPFFATFDYPLFEIMPTSLDEWVAAELATVDEPDVVISDVQVGATPAKLVLNAPNPTTGISEHRLYIWRADERNPRLVRLWQDPTSPPAPAQMAELMNRLVAGLVF